MITLNEILRLKGFDTQTKTKLVRHKDKRYDVWDLYKNNCLEIYQGVQNKPRFHECEFIISFLGLENSKSLLIGIYKKISQKSIDEMSNIQEIRNVFRDTTENDFFYDFEKLAGFEDLETRIVIDWGKAAISWEQWITNEKEIVEILPKGKLIKEFTDFYDVILDFHDLKTLINNPETNRIWYNKLSTVSGIYLILDDLTGKQYIGSAYGKEGIWGRWVEYVKTNGHGNNIELKRIIENDNEYFHNFRFTILRTLDKSLSDKEVIEYENLYKEKFGTRKHGYTKN